ncbi:MAG: NAD(P)/FAD-dependent oxidoreductase [Paracoccaceae bacterium]
MPFETPAAPPRRIAVIGGGISGMAAAHLLADSNAVVLFEAEGRLGGHARTVLAGKRGDQPVDTGFIVFNRVNYPHLVRLFEKLDVPVAKSSMSFGASINNGWLEYGLKDLNSVFAQRMNLLRPRYARLIRDILHFNKNGLALANDPAMTIGDLLARLGTGEWFRDYYLLPMSGAIWSTPSIGIMDFPAQAMMRFFDNHALLSARNQHQWYTVQGGSVEYVRRLQAALVGQGVDLRLGAGVQGVSRIEGGVLVRAVGGEAEFFDEVVFATHADDTLRMLSDASQAERGALGAVRYQPNTAVLHADTAMMPRSRRAWASWVYTQQPGDAKDCIHLTYWMNSLQPIPADDPLFVTLNPPRGIKQELIHDTVTFRHPVYDLATLRAQGEIRAMNGAANTWFCGAWMRNGFHEDGFASAVDVVEARRARDAAPVAAVA